MGLFQKIKNMFSNVDNEEDDKVKEEEIEEVDDDEEEIEEEEEDEEEEVEEEDEDEEEEVEEEDEDEEEEVEEEDEDEEEEVEEDDEDEDEEEVEEDEDEDEKEEIEEDEDEEEEVEENDEDDEEEIEEDGEDEEEEEVEENDEDDEEEIEEDEDEEEEVEENDEDDEEEIEEDDDEEEEEEVVEEIVEEHIDKKELKRRKKEEKLRLKEEKRKKKEEKNKSKNKKNEELSKSIKVYEKGLVKSRQGFVSKLVELTDRYHKITEEYFEELEEILIMADIGINTVMDFMDRLKKRVRDEKISDTELLKEIIVDELFIIYVNDEVLSNKINYNENGPTVILFVGVNGVGKTTTIGKIAYRLKKEGKKILLVGADTFRAGAVAQLDEWAKKVDVGFFGKEDSDPSSVVYDGIVKAQKEDYDVVLVDTAGRLQNKVNLMKELEKMNKVIDGLVEGGASETLLVLDATTGQNGISQAKAFKEITSITGIVLTKLDGTAKGGIVLAIKEEVGIPVKYIGLGETKDDLQVFDIEKYIYGLFKDLM